MKRRNSKADSREIEQIRRMKDLEGIIKKSDIENAFVSTISKDSEAVSSNIADNIIGKLAAEKINEKELSLIERMTTGQKPAQATHSKGSRDRRIHLVKRAGKPKGKAKHKPAKKKSIKKRHR
ncbi:MAG: hypothetical protein M1158_03280 [Candidatus Marsarchaeota archaeon]|jgi:hypothetical protein|nr:hypothetical protein [Candidatus Marsarchaeota archaeon]